MTDAVVEKLHVALNGKLGLECLLTTEEYFIADATSKAGFWRRKTQFCPRTTFSTSAEFRTAEKREIHKYPTAGAAPAS